MKKIVLYILMVLIFSLSACGGTLAGNTAQVIPATTQIAAAAQTNSAAQSANTESLSTNYTNAIPVEYQLLLGTFKLEGTSQSITADQANLLLPLWQQIQAFSPSMGPEQGNPSQAQAGASPTAQSTSSETQTQIDALVKQIQAAMTSDQVLAIAGMQLSQDSVMAILQSQGISIDGPGAGTSNGQQPPQGNPLPAMHRLPMEILHLPMDNRPPRAHLRPGMHTRIHQRLLPGRLISCRRN